MSFFVRLTVITALFGLLLGCGDHELEVDNQSNDDPPEQQQNNDPEPTPDFQEAAYDTLQPRCEKVLECCDQSEQELVFRSGTYESADECVESESGLFGITQGLLESSYVAERIDFDDVAVEGCIQSIQELSCDDYHDQANITETLPGCRNMIVPLVEEGESCSEDFECISGVCHEEDDDSVCRALPDQEGEDCINLSCDHGLYCDTLENTCRPIAHEGEACDDHAQCITEYCTDSNGEQTCQERGTEMCTG